MLQALLCLFLAACGGGTPAQDKSDLTVEGETYTVKEHSPILAKIKTQKIDYTPYSSEFQTVGTVRAITGHLAEVAVPFDGRVVSSSARLGQKVGAGTPLFSLNSPDFYDASKAFFQSRQNYELAEKNYQRKKQLLAGGIASKRDVEEAETERNNAKAEYQQAVSSMQVFNVNTEHLTMGQPLSVVSPIAGEVVKCEVTIGQFVRSDADALLTVADLAKVWVVAQVKERYLPTVAQGGKARIFTDAHPDEALTGTIYHVGELLDEDTRSVEVLIECDNANRQLKPGMYTSVQFQATPRQAILVPTTALFQNGDDTSVFVEKQFGVYERRIVVSESAGEGMACITAGLQKGEVIITDGGIFLSK